jgi:hypothetical protein
MERAAGDRPARKGDVDRLSLEAARLNDGAQLGDARGQGALDGLPYLVGDGSDSRPILRRQRADAAQNGCQIALLTEILNLELLQRVGIRCSRDLPESPRLQTSQIGAQGLEIHAGHLMSLAGQPRPRPAENREPPKRPLSGDESRARGTNRRRSESV